MTLLCQGLKKFPAVSQWNLSCKGRLQSNLKTSLRFILILTYTFHLCPQSSLSHWNLQLKLVMRFSAVLCMMPSFGNYKIFDEEYIIWGSSLYIYIYLSYLIYCPSSSVPSSQTQSLHFLLPQGDRPRLTPTKAVIEKVKTQQTL